ILSVHASDLSSHLMMPCPLGSTLFPYTTLFRSPRDLSSARQGHGKRAGEMAHILSHHGVSPRVHPTAFVAPTAVLIGDVEVGPEDRKSTRLNSSHVKISYAVFCLKKKKWKINFQ